MKKSIFVCLILVFAVMSISAGSLTGWGSWKSIDFSTEYRVRCVRWNTSVERYVWEVEVKNKSNRDLAISIAVSDNGVIANSDDYRRNTIDSGDSYVFPLMFSDAGPDNSVYVFWKLLEYKS